MRYLKYVKTDKEIVASENNDILYYSEESNGMSFKEQEAPRYYVNFSATGSGEITINKGYINVDGFIDSSNYLYTRMDSSNDKIIEGDTYYAYDNDGACYITINLGNYTQDDTIDCTIYYGYDESSKEWEESWDDTITVTKYNPLNPSEETISYTTGDSQKVEVNSKIVSIAAITSMTASNDTLISIELPVSIVKIDTAAFRMCTALSSVTYNGISYTNSTKLTSALKSKGVEVGGSVFDGTKLTSDIDFIDLGITNAQGEKVLWASNNIGGSTPESYGKYFQWGDTVGYYNSSHSTWATAPFNNGSSTYDSSFFTSNSGTWLTNDGVLKSDYDAATVAYGNGYRLPTKEEYELLTANTISTWEIVNGIKGRRFTSKLDGNKSIFIPAAGAAASNGIRNLGSRSYAWSSSLYTTTPSNAYELLSYDNTQSISNDNRYKGQTIRAVKIEN